MKILRSTKCTTKFMTDEKRQLLDTVLNEYSNVVNFFINHFWDVTPKKHELLKPIVDLPETWLSARLRKVAAREAIDMIASSKERFPDDPTMPLHRGERMCLSCTIAELNKPKKTKEFDRWLELRSIGNKISIDIPIKLHKHFNELMAKGKQLSSYIITRNYVQFCFEIKKDKKKEVHEAVGVDTGINALASLSNGKQFGTDIKDCIERIKRCKHGSKGQQRARRALRQRMDEVAKQVVAEGDLIVVENLKGLSHKTKLKRRLSKNIRRSIGSWNWKYWLRRLQMGTEDNRVVFRSTSPWNTSISCPSCGFADKRNRNREVFRCQKCGYTDNADINAARNILFRFLSGPYGAAYKPQLTKIL